MTARPTSEREPPHCWQDARDDHATGRSPLACAASERELSYMLPQLLCSPERASLPGPADSLPRE